VQGAQSTDSAAATSALAANLGAAGAATPTADNATQDARTAGAIDSTKGLQAPKGPDAAGSADRPLTGAAAVAAANAATNGVSKGAANAATSAASAANGNPPPAAGASAGSDATAQAATAAAMAAAATNVAASSRAGSTNGADSSTSADDLAAAAAGSAARAAAAANGASMPAPAVSMMRADAAAVATAAANAGAAAKLASAIVSDKHAPGGIGGEIGASPQSPASGDAAAGVASLSVNAASAADPVPTPTLKVAAGVDTPEFGQGLADRVSWMVDNNLNGAKLQVNPPQLGPIEVRISLQGDHAQVWLASHSALTRDALESSSPKLREMLGSQGFAQVSVDISQRSFQERSTQAQPYDWTPSVDRSASSAAVSGAAASMPRTLSGAVDAYA
jgi:flagellar hook-length control protein FliK